MRRSTNGQGRHMATKIVFHSFPPPASHGGCGRCWNAFRSLALVIGLFLCSISARAQLQQPFVFAADPANPRGIAVFTRNDLTGVLTPIPGSPFPSREEVNVMTLDFTARFLFTATYNARSPCLPLILILVHFRKFPNRLLPPLPQTALCFSPRKAPASFCT